MMRIGHAHMKFSPRTRRGLVSAISFARRTLMGGLIGVACAQGTPAAELDVQPGVVVKFGSNAGMTVRDTLHTWPGVVFTSLKDDASGGQTNPTVQTPAAGDWRGLTLDPLATPQNVSVRGLALRYAGSSGGAALVCQTNAYAFDEIQVANSIIGVRVTDGGAAHFTGVLLSGNQTGMEVDRGATPVVSNSDIHGNTTFGINNKTPATIVQATGNWWGASSGPHDVVGNPNGAGDNVSMGVNYGQFLGGPPLLDCSVQPANGLYTTSVPNITLALACTNATQYRVSKDSSFAGVNYLPMASQVAFSLSPAAGAKQIYTQYQGAGGVTATVQLTQPIVYTPTGPTIAITAPPANATIAANTTISADASDSAGVVSVAFFIDNALLVTINAPPYSTTWDIAAIANGAHAIKAVATNTLQQAAQDTRSVTVQKPGDTTGPSISNVRFAGAPLNAGDTITTAGALSFQVSDPSGVQAATLKIDGTLIPGGSLAGGIYTIALDFTGVANGSHVLGLGATDTLNNPSTLAQNFTLSLSVPGAPVITVPSNGAIVHQANLAVSGTAAIASQVQLYLNNAATGPLVTADGNGNFSGTITLAAEGSYTLQADARNARGTGPKSAAVALAYAIAAPTVLFTSPAANATLSAPVDVGVSVVDALGITGIALTIDGSLVTTLPNAAATYRWDVTQIADGTHTLRAVATNTAGKSGEATRSVTVQNVPPPPLSIVTASTGEVTGIAPATSYGTQPVVITGRAKDRTTGQAVPNATLRLVLQVGAFQRKIALATDGAGGFTYSFVPQPSDAGTYTVSVIHPDETTQTNQGQFTINRVSFNYSSYTLNAARGFASTIPLVATVSAGSGVSGLRFVALPEDQPSGSLPLGITIDGGAGVNLAAGVSAPVTINFTGSTTAAVNGTIFLTALASDSGSTARGRLRVDYRLSDPLPALYPTPTFIETGVQQGSTVSATVSLQNKGLIAATGVQVQLQNSDGSTNVPSWIYLASANQLGTLDVGQTQTLQVNAMPSTSVGDGIYNFKLHVTSTNGAGGDIPVAVALTQAGQGNVLFDVADIYTNTLDTNSQPIPGLANASIRIQNENVLTVVQTATSNAQGLATVSNLPTGTYIYRASSANHGDASGRILIRPGVTTHEHVFLDYNVISVEFGVTETTIQDHYDVTIIATYNTVVPAPVVLMEPLAINLPDLQVGEEYTGELSITNYGLVRADHVVFTPPSTDAYYRFEFLGTVPPQLEAKSRITVPYKVTALQLLPQLATSAQSRARRVVTLRAAIPADGGSCSSYSRPATLTYDYVCANGDTRGGGTGAGFSKLVGATCGGSNGGGGSGGNSGDGGGFGGPGGGPSPIPLTPACTPDCPTCGPGSSPGGGGPSSGGGGGGGAPATPQ